MSSISPPPPPIATLNLPQTILTGAGASKEVGAQLARLGVRHALIVTDPFFKQNGLADAIAAHIQAAQIASSIFAEVQPDPTDVNVRRPAYKRCANAGRMASSQWVAADAMDAAKAIAE